MVTWGDTHSKPAPCNTVLDIIYLQCIYSIYLALQGVLQEPGESETLDLQMRLSIISTISMMVSTLVLTRCVSMLKGRKVVRLCSSLDSILMPSREAHLPTWR